MNRGNANRVNASTPDEIRRGIAELGEWSQNIDLGGVSTSPHHFLGDYPRCTWRVFADALPADLRGWTVLDIGCNAGFYSVELKKRGAERVLGIDSDGHCLAQARFVADLLGVDIELEQMSVYEVGRLQQKFDLVLFMGGLRKLRHPLLALDLIHEHVARNAVIVQAAPGRQDDAHERVNDAEPASVEAMLRSAGFAIKSHPEADVFVCQYQPLPSEARAVYPARGCDDLD